MKKSNPNSPLRKLVRWVNGEPVMVPVEKSERPESTVRLDPANIWLQSESMREKTIPQRFHQWREKNAQRVFRQFYCLFSVVVCLVMIVTLLATVSFLPQFGNPDNPANNEVPQRYIEKGAQETGTINIVSGMILDYRAFDTLGESHVLFIAVCCVLILLRVDKDKNGKPIIEDMAGMDQETEPKGDVILKYTTAPLITMILIFGIYVILFGHLSAGGGFSGGAILGAGLILYRNAFGEERSRKLFSYKTFQRVSSVALLFYAVMKGYSFYMGANHLNSGIPLGKLGAILSGGLILPLNICVGCVVACTMYTFYALFCKGEV